MAHTYRIYGHGDKNEAGFKDVKAIRDYIGGGIFKDEDGRYRYKKYPAADTIILSRDGYAYGHFEINGIEEPTSQDLERYDKTGRVFIVSNHCCPANAGTIFGNLYVFNELR